MATTRFEIPGFGGTLIHPDDATYDDARAVHNAMIDRKPALIARCSSTQDVVRAVNLARDQLLPLAVYGGGHGVTGSHLFGRILSEAITGDLSRFDVFARLPWLPFPGGRTFRVQYCTIGSWYYSLRDALGV